MVYYAVIDTNVLVSALLTRHEDASPLQVVKRLFRGDIISLYDEEIVGEYAEVLRRPKFHFSETLIATMLQAIITYGISVERLITGEQLIDPKDLVFYEVAMTKRDEDAYLVTGNKKHFPEKVFIVSRLSWGRAFSASASRSFSIRITSPPRMKVLYSQG